MKNLFTRPISSKQTALAATLCLPLAAAVIFHAVYPHKAASPSPVAFRPSRVQLAEFYAPAPLPVPDLHRTPVGGLTLHDVRMGPILLVAVPGFEYPLEASVDGGRLTVTDSNSRTTVWSGPVSQAAFRIWTRTGIHTLFDLHGKKLWAETSILSSPDLLLQEKTDGSASLIGKQGNVLWAGRIDPKAAQRDMSVTDPSLHVPGIRLKIDDNVFHLTDNTGHLFLSGPLASHSTVLAKYDNSVQYVSPVSSGTDIDQDDQVQFQAVTGNVVIADSGGNTLGTLPVKEIVIQPIIRYAWSPLSSLKKYPPEFRWPQLYRGQSAMLNAMGTVTLSYRSPDGNVFRKVQVMRDHHYCWTIPLSTPFPQSKQASFTRLNKGV